jgi:hypothetical protein
MGHQVVGPALSEFALERRSILILDNFKNVPLLAHIDAKYSLLPIKIYNSVYVSSRLSKLMFGLEKYWTRYILFTGPT